MTSGAVQAERDMHLARKAQSTWASSWEVASPAVSPSRFQAQSYPLGGRQVAGLPSALDSEKAPLGAVSHRLGAEVGEVILDMREKEPSLRDTARQAGPWLEP